MDYIIRKMAEGEYLLLNVFLYEAIYIPDGAEPPPASVIKSPELQEYIFEFGKSKHDKAFVAEVEGKVIGAVWVRIMNDYGHIDDATPSLAISVFRKYRGVGVGRALLRELLSTLRLSGYARVSLSVQKANYAAEMYKKAGFDFVDENDEEYIMAACLWQFLNRLNAVKIQALNFAGKH